MAFGNIGKVIAGQALEATKKNVLEAFTGPEAGKAAGSAANKLQAERQAQPPSTESVGATILGQLQAMQRPLKEDQELLVLLDAGVETLRVLEIFVPSLQVFVFAGIDAEHNVTRVVVPAERAQLVCKIMKVPVEEHPIRVHVLSPRPKPEPQA